VMHILRQNLGGGRSFEHLDFRAAAMVEIVDFLLSMSFMREHSVGRRLYVRSGAG